MYWKSGLHPANFQTPVNPGFRGKPFQMRKAALHYRDERQTLMCCETRWMNTDGDKAWEWMMRCWAWRAPRPVALKSWWLKVGDLMPPNAGSMVCKQPALLTPNETVWAAEREGILHFWTRSNKIPKAELYFVFLSWIDACGASASGAIGLELPWCFLDVPSLYTWLTMWEPRNCLRGCLAGLAFMSMWSSGVQ